ncbi:MAG: hypothetical protein KKF33_07095 [Alphaproteobacteria bacterium]|jgi:hypothetical protein|nr:hypothetical protein [Alphaproteobacteria bacterium]
MNKIIISHKISKALAVAGLLAAGGFAIATPASAAPANCTMTANPPVSLMENLSTYDWSVRNANIDKCQVAEERAEASAVKVGSNMNATSAEQAEPDGENASL